MGDILSQDEIDALLSVTDVQKSLAEQLKALGFGKNELLALHQHVEELVKSELDADGQLDSAVMRVRSMLKDKKLVGARLKAGRQALAERLQEARQDYERKAKEKKARGSGPIITNYDFKHPARVNRQQLRTLENLHDNFARLLSSTFSGALRTVVDVDTAFVDQTTYAEFINSLSNPSCSYQFALGSTNGQAILDFAIPIVFGSVDRVFGGKGSSQGIDARQLSQIEMGVFARIVKRAIEDLEATWEPILKVEISDIELETNPEFMQITAASEIVILLAFEINSTNMSGLVSLCYPFFTLESILPLLGQQNYVYQRRQNREETIRQNQRRLANTSVPLHAELGSGTLSVTQARRVQVGDVLQVDTRKDEPVVVYVGEEPKFLGLPFTGAHGANTVKISQVLDAASAERLKNRSRPVPLLPLE